MAAFAQRAYNNAKRQIKDKGCAIVLVQRTIGSYNPNTGTYDTIETKTDTIGHIESFDNALIASGVANFDDISIMMVAPFIDKTSNIEYNGETYNIIAITDKIVTQNKDVAYTVQARK